MAYVQSYNVSSNNQFIVDFKAFIEANGWTVDLYDPTYTTSYRRLHFHKGAAHFELISQTNTTSLSLYRCTGYASSSGPSVQPGAGNLNGVYFTVTVGGTYWFVSTIGAVWMACVDLSNNFNWGGCYILQTKIGAFSDGFGSFTPSACQLFSNSCGNNPYYNQIYFNGSWGTPNGAGALSGSGNTSDLPNKQPNWYNAGVVPMPLLVAVLYSLDISKKQPVGFAPGVFRCNGGDLYDIGDQLVIGADTYVIFPRYTGPTGNSSYGDYLFKLGA